MLNRNHQAGDYTTIHNTMKTLFPPEFMQLSAITHIYDELNTFLEVIYMFVWSCRENCNKTKTCLNIVIKYCSGKLITFRQIKFQQCGLVALLFYNHNRIIFIVRYYLYVIRYVLDHFQYLLIGFYIKSHSSLFEK